MDLVACPNCGARFDVSSMTPGSTFVCGACQNTLQVPGGSAGPRPARAAPPSRPSAPGPSKGSGRRVDPRRAGGGAAPAPSAPPPVAGGRPAAPGRRPPRRSSGDSGGGKSNLPLVLGGVGGLVVVIGIVAALALSGNDNPAPGGGGTTTAAGGGGNTGGNAPAVKDEQKELARELLSATTIGEYQRIHEAAVARGFTGVAKDAAEAALAKDPDLPWANAGVGKKDLGVIFKRYLALVDGNPDVDTYANDDVRALKAMMDEEEWGTPEEYAKAETLLAAAKTHADRLENDTAYADIARTKVWIRAHPVYSSYEYEVGDEPPYVIAVQHDEKRADLAGKILERNKKVFGHLYHEFLRIFGKAYDLPDLSTRKTADERVLKVFTFIDEAAFRKYQEVIRNRLPAGVRAYYSPRDQWITLFEGSGSEKAAVEGESDFNTNKTFHEGTHQLIHIFTKILLERDANGEDVEWDDPRTQSRAHWFQEGFAELMGSSKPRADGLWDLMALNRSRAVEWRRAQKAKDAEWDLGELLRIRNSREMMSEAKKKALGGADKLASLFYAQAWAFNHFLWYGGDGKYREKLIKYFGMELNGRSGYEEWKEAFGKKDDDWSDLDREWRAYFDGIVKKLGIE